MTTINIPPSPTLDQDLVVPSLKYAYQFASSPLLAAPLQQQQQQQQPTGGSGSDAGDDAAAPRHLRDILLFFRGDVGKHRLEHYRCGRGGSSTAGLREL